MANSVQGKKQRDKNTSLLHLASRWSSEGGDKFHVKSVVSTTTPKKKIVNEWASNFFSSLWKLTTMTCPSFKLKSGEQGTRKAAGIMRSQINRSNPGKPFWSCSVTATTFNRRLIHVRGVGMSQEHLGKGVHFALGPMMNLGRVAGGG